MKHEVGGQADRAGHISIAPAREDLVFVGVDPARPSRASSPGNRSDAEDATQEAMTRAWAARRSLREPASFDAWFDRILVNCCRERLRRRNKIREIPLPEGGEAERGDEFASVLARDSIGRALASLTLDQRTVVVLRFWLDLSLEQIADRLAWPLGTVKSRLHHALAAMRVTIAGDDPEVQS